MNPRRLLWIDDDRLQSRLVEQQLKAFRRERFQLEWQETFERGLERLLTGEHEVCLLDLPTGSTRRLGTHSVGERSRL